VASTKAFSTQITLLSLMALKLAEAKGHLGAAEFRNYLRELDSLPEKMAAVLAQNTVIEAIAAQYKDHRNALYLGRGYNFPVALEGALKLKEISYIHAEGYPAAEMKHGPIALIDAAMPVVVIAPNTGYYHKILSNAEEIKSRHAQIIAVVSAGDTQMAALADHVIEVPETFECFTPLLTTIPLQLLSYHITHMLGLNVDQPRNLAKSVTVE